MFAFGPAGSKPVAGKWIAPSKPPISGVINGGQAGDSANLGDGTNGD